MIMVQYDRLTTNFLDAQPDLGVCFLMCPEDTFSFHTIHIDKFYLNTVELQWLEPDGSFTMDESNTFLSPWGFPPNTIYG